MKAPTFVPISPVIWVAPVLLNAPTAVNAAKLAAVPKGGVCPKLTAGKNNRLTVVRKSSNLVFIFFLFNL